MIRRFRFVPVIALAIIASPISKACGQTPGGASGARRPRVRLGVEVLLSDSMHLVRGKRVGLITNQSGTIPDGRTTIDLLHDAPGVRLTAFFAPEHGLCGTEAAGQRIAPNPLRGDRVEGGVLNPTFRSFVGQFPVALRYGLTPGELLRYLVGSGLLSADVTVVPMIGWQRSMRWEDTGLPWHNPSPNIRSPDAALLYTGTVYFEGTNLSEGRGTAFPFQLIGAGWLNDAGAIARELNARRIPRGGLRFGAGRRRSGAEWGGERIPMVAVVVSDRNVVAPQQVGLELLRAIYIRHPREFEWKPSIDRLAGSDRLRKAVQEERGIERLMPILEAEAREFELKTRPYRLYK
jgi:uncharacterized protein YbbC (DUF1343 family)